MAKIQPSTRSFSAGSVFLPGGSITFGNAGIIPDPDNPATLKAVYLDENQTQIAQNPQPLDSNASFQQASDGILYGSGTYSVIWKNAAQEVVYQNLNFELLEDFGSAAFVNTGTASNEVPLNSDLADVLRDSDIGQTVAGLTSSGATNWDSGNLNKSVFTGDPQDFCMTGYVRAGNTTAILFKDINFVSAPSSITVTSTFTVNDVAGSILSSGQTPVISPASSNGILAVTAGGITSSGSDRIVTLRYETGTSQIEVNE